MNENIRCPECGEPLLLIYEGKIETVATLTLDHREDLAPDELLHFKMTDGVYKCFSCYKTLTREYKDAESLYRKRG